MKQCRSEPAAGVHKPFPALPLSVQESWALGMGSAASPRQRAGIGTFVATAPACFCERPRSSPSPSLGLATARQLLSHVCPAGPLLLSRADWSKTLVFSPFLGKRKACPRPARSWGGCHGLACLSESTFGQVDHASGPWGLCLWLVPQPRHVPSLASLGLRLHYLNYRQRYLL